MAAPIAKPRFPADMKLTVQARSVRLPRQRASFSRWTSMRVEGLRRSPGGWRARAAGNALLLTSALAVSDGAGGADAGAGDGVAPGGPLQVASYNVQFVTPDLPLLGHVLREWPGHKPNVTERAAAIAERLACFDIIAFQETINDQRRREILDRLETAGRACGKPSRLPSGRMFAFVEGPEIEDGAWLPLVGNELTLASRLPIVRTGAHVYRHAAEVDVLAAKGVLHVRLGAWRRHARRVRDASAGGRTSTARCAAPRSRSWRRSSGAKRTARRPGSRARRLQCPGQRRGPAGPGLRLQLPAPCARCGRGAAPLCRRLARDARRRSRDRQRHQAARACGRHAPRRTRSASTTCSSPAQARRRARCAVDFFASDLMVDGAPVGDLSDHAALLAEIAWPRTRTVLRASQAPSRRRRPSSSVPERVGAGRVVRRVREHSVVEGAGARS